jgi:hypothetical protein
MRKFDDAEEVQVDFEFTFSFSRVIPWMKAIVMMLHMGLKHLKYSVWVN